MSDTNRVKLAYVVEDSFGVQPLPVASKGNLTIDVNPTGEAAAQGTLTMDVNPSDGDTVTIDGKTYTFQNVLTNFDGNIEIDASLAQTQLNLENATNLTGTPGVGYAADTTIHPTVSIAPFGATVPDDAVLSAKTPGSAGNSIATTETFTAPTNVFDAATLGTTQLGTDSDTMTIDTKVYTFQNTLTNVDGHVHVGATLADTQNNLVAAINNSGGTPGLDYAAANTAHPTVTIAGFVSDVAEITAITAGTVGDSIATTETFVAPTNVFGAATLSGGVDIQLKDLRITSEGLGQDTATETSNEIRADRQIPDVIRTRINSDGDLGFELSYGTYDDILESVLFSAGFSAPVVLNGSTFSVLASDNSLNDSSDSFVSGGYKQYQWVKTEGFVNAENNGFFKIVSVSPGKLILSGGTVVDEDDQGVAAQGTLTLDTQPTPSAAAEGALTMDTNPSDGDTMTVDSKTYTFETVLTNVDGNIQIGASVNDTQNNLVAAFDLSGTPGTDYAAAMTAHPTVDIAAFAADDAVLTAKTPGTAGNSITTTETFTAGTNVFDALTLGTTTLGVDADTMTIDTKVYTFDANGSLQDVDGHIEIGLTVAQTQLNIVDAINLTGVPGTGYALSMTQHPTVFAGAFATDDSIITARVAGAPGNSIATTETFAAVTNVFDAATLGTTTLGSGNSDVVTMTMLGEIVNGVTERSILFEKQFTDLANAFEIFLGTLFESFGLTVTAEQIITGTFSTLGKKPEKKTATIGNIPNEVAPTNSVMSAVDDVSAILESSIKQRATSFTLTLVNNLRGRPEIAELGFPSIGAGTINVTGTFQAYFTDQGLVEKYLDFTDSSLALIAEDRDSNAYVIELPQVRFTSGRTVAGGQNQDVIADLGFEAFLDPCEKITIRIARFTGPAVNPCP